jgi:hypothetical protein
MSTSHYLVPARSSPNYRAHQAPMGILWNLGNSLTILVQYFNLETMAFKLFGNYPGNN